MQKRDIIHFDNFDREFLIFIPDGIAAEAKVPVIISLHGTLGSAEQMMAFADFRGTAAKEKFLVVCPEGVTQTWNDGRATKANLQGIDDVGFISTLIGLLKDTYQADGARIYLAGMSNGGFMASRLACEIPESIAAIAVVAATMDRSAALKPSRPMPVMYIHGNRDRLVPFVGGATKAAGGDVYGHEEVIRLWAALDGCDQEPLTTATPDYAADQTVVVKKEFCNAHNGLKVISYTIINGGHTWPGGPQYAPANFVGLTSGNLNACDEICRFFDLFQFSG